MVEEVYIPPRKEKLGNRFGFVRFLNVQKLKEHEEMLNWILIGNQKLSVNIPKYDRDGKNQRSKIVEEHRRWKARAGIRNGPSYAETVSREGITEEGKAQPLQPYRRRNQNNNKQ